jgi:adenylate cyclase
MLKRWGAPLLLGAACALLFGLWHRFDDALGGMLRIGELKTYDLRMKSLFPSDQATRDVIFIEQSQNSLDNYQEQGVGWPWPRVFYGMMLRSCPKAKLVLYDYIFDSMDPQGSDQEFASDINRHGKVILAFFHNESRQASPPMKELSKGYQIRVHGSSLLRGVPRATYFNFPYKTLRESSTELGSVLAQIDSDGMLRRAPLLIESEGVYFPSLSLRALLRIKGVKEVTILPGLRMRVADLEFPIDEAGRLLLRYYGPQKTFKTISIERLIQTGYGVTEGDIYWPWISAAVPSLKVDPRIFEGKILVVGTTAAGLMDHFPTPMDEYFPGAEAHATAVANMLNYGMMTPPQAGLTLLLVIFSSMIGALVFVHTRIQFALIFFAGMIGALILAAVVEFNQNRWLEVFPPLLTTVVVFSSSQVYNYLTEGRKRHLVTNTFKRYVAPAVVNELLKNPELVNMMGSRKRLTILFLDFEGFTKLSEKMDPKDLMELLNQYHREGVAEIFATEGTFDKFVGDAIVAYWGAPIDQLDQAVRACRTAVGIQKRLKRLHEEAKDGKLFRARIGLNTGECIWGNVGQGILQNISIIGDEVNLTSRLEGANKLFGTQIMISESTYLEAKDRLVVREIGPIRVVGKVRPVRVYELIGIKGEVDEAATEAFADAWKKFYARDFLGALAIFSSFDDKLAKKCSDECKKLIERPPGEAWEFVIDVESK